LLLVLWYAGNVVGKRSLIITRLGRVEAQKLSKKRAVLGVFVDTELEILAEGRVELVEVLAILSNFVEEFESLLDNILANDLHDLVLLKSFTRQVQWKILRVDNTLNETKPFWDEIGGIISDEDTADIELDIVLGALGLEEIKGSALWNKQNSTELELTLNREVLDSEVILPIV